MYNPSIKEIGPGIEIPEFMELSEIPDPASPAVNKCRLFCRDNGAGKTQLAVIFNSGAIQILATEP